MLQNSKILKFKPAKISKGKEWFVFYYFLNPTTDKLHRKKVKVNFIESLAERKKYAENLVREINKKLYSDWNPFTDELNPRGLRKLTEIMDEFFNSKKRELRPDSLRSYKSYIHTLNLWLNKFKKSEIRCDDFSKVDAIEFLQWVYIQRNLSSRTFNNYKMFFCILWNWLKEHQYVSSNPFEKIAKKATTGKERIIIDHDTRERVKNHLEKNDYNFLIVCQLVFHALIRPKEIANLKPSNFELHNQVIRIPASVSKNKTERLATVPNSLMKFLKDWDYNKAKENQYIFSTDFLPGSKPIDARRFTKKWDYLRDDLKLDSKMKLYSLRDSGIIQMLQDGISPEEVMRQADHSSLEITSIYVKHAKPNGSEQIKQNASKF